MSGRGGEPARTGSLPTRERLRRRHLALAGEPRIARERAHRLQAGAVRGNKKSRIQSLSQKSIAAHNRPLGIPAIVGLMRL